MPPKIARSAATELFDGRPPVEPLDTGDPHAGEVQVVRGAEAVGGPRRTVAVGVGLILFAAVAVIGLALSAGADTIDDDPP